jgi:hypothetical protein
MDSTGRFLLGGALGAALGYLISQKNLEKALQSGQLPSAEIPALDTSGADAEPRAGGAPEAAAVTPATVAAAPVSAPEQRPAPVREPDMPVPEWRTTPEVAPEWRIPPAPPVDWRPVPQPVPASPVSAAPAAPVLNAPAGAQTPGVAESLVAEEAEALEIIPAIEEAEPVAQVAQPADSDITLTRDFLEEPLPGSGWGPRAGIAVEEEALEDTTSVVPDVVLSHAGPELELERPRVESPDAAAVLARSEQVSEEPVADLPVLEELVELPVVEELVELPVVEESLTEITRPGMAEAEALAGAATVAERLPVVERAPLGDAALVDDLKSRIEETRRRIRHELEQPFDTAEGTKPPEPDWTVSAAVPVVEEAIAVEPLPTQALAAEPIRSETDELVVERDELETGLESGAEEPIDYDSMKDRIESTRSRLKAKAFDAMMTGESALLGRDAEGADHGQRPVPGVDSEVDETIETSLREEEE